MCMRVVSLSSSCNFFLTTPCTSWRIKRQNLMRFVKWQREQKCIMPSTFYIQFWFCIRESRWWFFLYIYSSSSPRSLLLHLARICNGKREKNVYQAKYIVKKKPNQRNTSPLSLMLLAAAVIVAFSRNFFFVFSLEFCRFSHFDLTGWNISKD